MSLNFWSVLLIATASQAIFLIVRFLLTTSSNKKAKGILIGMLFVILMIITSNLVSATYLYRDLPAIAGFARGMVLLLGPLLYMYVHSLIVPNFSLKWVHLVHFAPYVVAFTFFRLLPPTSSDADMIASTDQLMGDGVEMDWQSTGTFVVYALHLLAYIALSYRDIRLSVRSESGETFVIPLKERHTWLTKMGWMFAMTATVFIFIIGAVLYSGVYTIVGNVAYTIMLSLMVYWIAFQAMTSHELLVPGFAIKYRSVQVNPAMKEQILERILQAFENEKLFTNPRLTVAEFAKHIESHPNVVSQIVNEKLKKSFTDLLHDYRIKEFKRRVTAPDFQAYSIQGVAFDVGYTSKSAFNNAFKKLTAMTPSEYVVSVRGPGKS